MISFSESQLDVIQEWEAHEFELWAASFDIHQPQLVYTGSDDCKFSCWDLRDDPCNLVFQNYKIHKMDICCMAKNPIEPNILPTRSYHGYLRLWDVRSISKPVNETLVCLGRGVWRKSMPRMAPLLTVQIGKGGNYLRRRAQTAIPETRVLRRATALLTLGSRNKSFLAGLGSTIADSSTCCHYRYIIRAYGNLFVIKAWFIAVSCQPNFMGCSIYALSLSGDDGIS
ncbi:hypothetical protein POTOM_043178 [Populus tomentosa]|uniref:Transducin/WD40 repeat-like superfamily protein n=1 Tax=Populus tomentosa TaxID=118781 RepID=A0A8X7YLB8_POPTO|nr:hypothetical protein POTOM_043178 [Populus tomentosa]